MNKVNQMQMDQPVIKDDQPEVKPRYTKSEELMHMISHIVGAVFSLVFLIMLTIKSTLNNDIPGLISSIVFSLCSMILYGCSAYYHGLRNVKYKKVFRVLDHCSIYLLIAGTYTVISIGGVLPMFPTIGWLMFSLVWGLAILGVVLNAINLDKFKIPAMILNILAGWVAIFFANYVIKSISLVGFLLVLLGGIFYTVGAVLYGIGKKKKYFHFIFHIFCVLGTVSQFIAIFMYCV